MKRTLIFLYIAALHVLLITLLFRPQIIDEQRWRLGLAPPEPSAYVMETHRMMKAIDRQAAAGSLVLIGDSHFQRMPGDLLPDNALNFGIGGDTVRHMVERAEDYRSLDSARAIMIWGGYNDLLRRGDEAVARDMERLLDMLPDDRPAYLISLSPVGELNPHDISVKQIRALNHRYLQICTKPCEILNVGLPLSLNSGDLNPKFDSGDGIHLNRAGYLVVAEIIDRLPN